MRNLATGNASPIVIHTPCEPQCTDLPGKLAKGQARKATEVSVRKPVTGNANIDLIHTPPLIREPQCDHLPGKLAKGKARKATEVHTRNPATGNTSEINSEPQCASLPGKLAKGKVRKTTEAGVRTLATGTAHVHPSWQNNIPKTSTPATFPNNIPLHLLMTPPTHEFIDFTLAPKPEISSTATQKENKPCPFIINGFIAGHKARILIDTGSDINTISNRFVQRHRLRTATLPGPTIEVRSASGEPMYAMNQCTSIPLQLTKSHLQNITLGITNASSDVILGVPWIRENQPQFDWEHNAMVFSYKERTIIAPFTRTPSSLPDIISALSYVRLARLKKQPLVMAVVCNLATEVGQDTTPEIITQVLTEFHDVFPDKLPPGLPPKHAVDHKIDLEPGARPQACNPYRLSPEEMTILRERIQELLELGYICPSSSPWGAPVLFAKKKDGTLRMCIDYHALNKLTIRNRFPLPRIDELFDQLQGAKYFSKLDLDSAYHQVRVDEADISKTAFTCQLGHFEFLVLTFGFTNAPATFQTLMSQVFSEHLRKFIVIYLDDILIFSKTLEEHVQHLCTALQLLCDNSLCAKRKKCLFATQSVDYLGHIITSEGIRTDSAKIAAIQQWPTPANQHDVRSFLGLANYYCCFIHKYSEIATPLTQLLQKDISFLWKPVHQASFDLLKYRLTNAPILRLADPNLPYRIEVDSSDFALGAMVAAAEPELIPILSPPGLLDWEGI
jgi:hypothetical protein